MQIARIIRVGEKNTRVLTSDGRSVLLRTELLRDHFNSLERIRVGVDNIRYRYPDGSSVLVPKKVIQGFTRAVQSNQEWAPTKFGIEFEFLCPTTNVDELARRLEQSVSFLDRRHSYGAAVKTYWTLTHDGSVHDGTGYRGYELVSPVLTRDNFDEVKTVLNIMDEFGCFVLKCCGTHVHFSFGHDTTQAQREFMFDEYGKWEFFFDRLVSKSRRGNSNHYCKSCNDHGYGDRYHKFNIAAYAKHGTCEVRQHQGTLSYRKITNWMNMMSKWFEVIHAPNYVVPSTVEQAIEMLGLNADEVNSRIVQLES